MSSSQNGNEIRPIMTITKTVDLYDIKQLKVVNPRGYEKALEGEVERLQFEWELWREGEIFALLFEELGEYELVVEEWYLSSGELRLGGYMNTPEAMRVARALSGEAQIEEVKLRLDRSWAGWECYISNRDMELTDEEGEMLLARKRELEFQIGQGMRDYYFDWLSEESIVESSMTRGTLSVLDGCQFDY